MKEITYLKREKIVPSSLNPRKSVDENSLADLAASLKQNGMISPICVRPKDGKYEIVYGERRYLAAGIIKMKEVPCLVRELTDEEAEDLSITENLQRVDISPMDEAKAYLQLQEHRNYSTQDLAIRFGKSRVYITQRLMLNNMIEPFAQLLEKELIGVGISLEICKLTDKDQADLYKDLINGYQEEHLKIPTIKAIRRHISFNYQLNLADAPFSIYRVFDGMDVSCDCCPKNTAVNGFLFPDMSDDARCTDGECFNRKKEIHFAETLKRVTEEEPDTVLVAPKWLYGSDKEAAENMKKDGYLVREVHGYEVIDKPEPPDPDDSDSPEEYSQEMANYEKELETYQNLDNDKTVRKALVVAGSEKGNFCYVKNADDDTEGAGGDGKGEKIGALIQQKIHLQDLKFQNIYKDVLAAFKNSDYATATGDLTEIEMVVLMVLMLPYCSKELKEELGYNEYELSREAKVELCYKLQAENQMKVIRGFILNKLDINPDYETSGIAQVLIELAKRYDQHTVDDIEKARNAEYEKRKAKIEAAIHELEGAKTE